MVNTSKQQNLFPDFRHFSTSFSLYMQYNRTNINKTNSTHNM